MINDILTYIEDFQNIRAATGLNSAELPDSDLVLSMYKTELGYALSNISGVYAPSTTSETLIEIFARLADTDPMYGVIHLFAIYTTADIVVRTVGLKAYKSIADGKATQTRFSPESTYVSVQAAISERLEYLRGQLDELFGETEETVEYLSVVTPSVDLVVGDE